MNDTDDLGWGRDHVEKLIRLRSAIRRLAGGGKIRDRFDAATSYLTTYSERDFPEHLRPVFARIMDARVRSRWNPAPGHAVFALDSLSPTERKQLVADLTCLVDACSIDLGRKWSPDYDFMYPKKNCFGQRASDGEQPQVSEQQ